MKKTKTMGDNLRTLNYQLEKEVKSNRKIVLVKPVRRLKIAFKYWLPKRLTLKSNPRIHAWLWWNF